MKALLLAIGGANTQDSMLAILGMEKCKSPLLHQLAFQVKIFSKGWGVHRTVIDEGASTCIISASYWLTLGSPTLSPPLNSLNAFNGFTFIQKGYLASYPIILSGKIVMVDIKVVDKKLDYNLFSGHSWTYTMTAIVSTIFHIILFPLDGNIVTMD